MEKKAKIIIFLSLILLVLLFSFSLVFGQERELEIKYPEIFGLKPTTTEISLPEYAKYIFNFSVALVGLILFAVLIGAGFLYLTSAGQPTKIKEAKERIISVFLGAILLLSSYIILTTINPQLKIFELPPLEKTTPPPPKPVQYKPEKITQIFWEIPLGQMAEEGLWEEKRTNDFKKSISDFKEFLQDERISDLIKELQSLSNDCQCDLLDAICQKPKNFAFPVGLTGDPCKEVREKMDKLVEKILKKIVEIQYHQEKLKGFKKVFFEEGRKFRNLNDKILANCQEKGLLTRAEYYQAVADIEEMGGETKLEKIYRSSKDDPAVFYCPVGGTIYDYPYSPEPFPYEEVEKAEEFATVPVEGKPLSCPARISLGEVLEDLSMLSFQSNVSLEELIDYNDFLLKTINEFFQYIFQCNKDRCEIDCSCISNPCYEKCELLCTLFCKSPCLQALGGGYGEACPTTDLSNTAQLIKIYEDEIFKRLDAIKDNIKKAKSIITNREEKANLNLIRANLKTCLDLGAKTAISGKPEEEPLWFLLRCELALGNKGPDGKIITNCYPTDFYCCSSKPVAVSPFQPSQEIEIPAEERIVETPLIEKVQPPSSKGFNNVPYFSQYDERWRTKKYGCGKNIGDAGCGPTSFAMALNFGGEKIDPPTAADWVLKNHYRICGQGTAWEACCKAVESLGREEGMKCQNYHLNAKKVLDELRKNQGKAVAVVSGRGVPPYTGGGHYIVLTGIEKEWGKEFVHYNDPAYEPGEKRLAQGRKPIDWFEKTGIRAGCVIYYK